MKKKKEEYSEDNLGLEVGSWEQKVWLDVVKACRVQIENLRKELFVQEAILKLALSEHDREKAEFRKV